MNKDEKSRNSTRLIVLASIITGVFVLSKPVRANMVDFEGTGLSEGASLTTEIAGLTFVNTIIAKEGYPEYGFSPGDIPVGGAPFGGFFITDPLVGGDAGIPQTIAISFHVPVFDVSFSLADLDLTRGTPEVLTAQAFDASNTLLESITITAGAPGTGDGIATLVNFSTNTDNVSRLTLAVTSQSGRSGWGVDNLSFTPVPVPGAILLGLLGLGVAGLKLRKYA